MSTTNLFVIVCTVVKVIALLICMVELTLNIWSNVAVQNWWIILIRCMLHLMIDYLKDGTPSLQLVRID